MSENDQHQIILYDLACTKNVCFSPVVWRIRLMLNYKRVPYNTVFFEFPDIETRLREFGVTPLPEENGRYTVPSILHIPTNTYMMDSKLISEFFESTYPYPPVPLTSKLAREIETKARGLLGGIHSRSIIPREINILSPPSQKYFRPIAEARLGRPLEDLLVGNREEQDWKLAAGDLQAISELMQTHKADGPFILGAQPSYVDFFIAGSLQSARVIDEGVFQRYMEYAGFEAVYEACSPYLEKNT